VGKYVCHTLTSIFFDILLSSFDTHIKNYTVISIFACFLRKTKENILCFSLYFGESDQFAKRFFRAGNIQWMAKTVFGIERDFLECQIQFIAIEGNNIIISFSLNHSASVSPSGVYTHPNHGQPASPQECCGGQCQRLYWSPGRPHWQPYPHPLSGSSCHRTKSYLSDRIYISWTHADGAWFPGWSLIDLWWLSRLSIL